MSVDGTESGTFVKETIPTDGVEVSTTIKLGETPVRNEIGTATGDDHVDGTVTCGGTGVEIET
jgi:molybdopterin biosynthesis enzyme MoaB